MKNLYGVKYRENGEIKFCDFLFDEETEALHVRVNETEIPLLDKNDDAISLINFIKSKDIIDIKISDFFIENCWHDLKFKNKNNELTESETKLFNECLNLMVNMKLFSETSMIKRTFVTEVIKKDVQDYFLKWLTDYKVLDVLDYSNNKIDNYLFMVVAQHKKNKTYTVWTCWNGQMHSLNHGHYGLETLEECKDVLEEYYKQY